MAKCKTCKVNNPLKNKTHHCDTCKVLAHTCPKCGNKKSKSTYHFCKKCQSSDLTYRNNLSASLKGKASWAKGLTKETNESLKNMSNLKKGVPLSDEHKVKLSIAGKDRKFTKEHCENLSKALKGKSSNMLGKKHTDETKERMRNKMLERYENGEIQKSPKSNWYEFQGLKCQGRTELKWVERNFDRIINSRIYISTPHGTYIGDFETNDSLIEVKSFYTFSVISQNQLDKIMWIDKNIKKIIFAVERDNKFYEFSYNNEGVDWAIEKMKEINKTENNEKN
jgi:hypothetical protein